MVLKTSVFSTLITVLLLIAIGLSALAISCGSTGGAGDKIGVVVSMFPLADFVENVGQAKVDVNVMVRAREMENDDCILCGNCVDNCPKQVISYTFSAGK